MNGPARLRMWCAGLAAVALLLGCVSPSLGQAEQSNGEGYRKLAPGVMQSIDPAKKVRETFARHDIVELLAIDPSFDWAKGIPFRHDVWHLELKFKPVRMILVDVPQPSGLMRQELIWYMVYSVTNHGQAMHPTKDADGTFKVESKDLPARFVPEFSLESDKGGKVYPDRLIPIALGPIGLREDPKRKFHTSVSISEKEIEVGQTVWGVAMWEKIDPRTDRFIISVKGLTNAYKWGDEPGAYKAGDPVGTGRKLVRKTLRLNFWRPGDEYYEHEGEIRYGFPGEVDYEWVYR